MKRHKRHMMSVSSYAHRQSLSLRGPPVKKLHSNCFNSCDGKAKELNETYITFHLKTCNFRKKQL